MSVFSAGKKKKMETIAPRRYGGGRKGEVLPFYNFCQKRGEDLASATRISGQRRKKKKKKKNPFFNTADRKKKNEDTHHEEEEKRGGKGASAVLKSALDFENLRYLVSQTKKKGGGREVVTV